MTDPRQKGRRALLLLALVFFGPLAVAITIYFSDFAWRPAATTEHGVLFQPPPRIADHALAPAGQLEGKWSLIYLGEGACNDACREALTTMRQVRLALAQDADRVQRVFFPTGAPPDPAYLQAEHSGLLVTRDDAGVAAFAATVGAHRDGEIFLADPRRNLVLRYPTGTAMRDIHKDLQRLLKVSRIG
jgi:hypothetical protein